MQKEGWVVTDQNPNDSYLRVEGLEWNFSFHVYTFLYLFPFFSQIAYYFCNQKEIIVLFFKLICVPQLPAPLWKWNNLFSKRCAWKDPSGMGEVRHTHVTTLRVRVRLWKNTSDATPLARFWSRLLFLLLFLTRVFFLNFFNFYFLATLCSMQDPISLSRDLAHTPCIGSMES